MIFSETFGPFTVYTSDVSKSFLYASFDDPELFMEGLADYLLSEDNLLNYANSLTRISFTATPAIYKKLYLTIGAFLNSELELLTFDEVSDEVRDALGQEYCFTDVDGKTLVQKDKIGKIGEYALHAGEDFRHLLSGLRRIYETVHYLKFHAGDRIGHGLALGIKVDDWYKDNPNVILPRIEALENYLWAYKMLSSYQSEAEAGDLLYLEQKIRELSREVFCPVENDVGSAMRSIPTEILLEGYEALFKNSWEANKRCLDGNGVQEICPLKGNFPSTKEQICCAYHCQRFAAQMNEPIHYHVVPQEIRILKIVQEQMQQFISQRGIVVETNPTSNLTISSVDTLHQHPMYEISKYGYDYKNIFVCVNSDDPGVFQTNAANELGLAYMGLIEHGVGREASLRWIDRLRENGMLSSFVNQPESDEQLMIDLEDILERFR